MHCKVKLHYITIGNQIGRGANGRILEAKWEGVVIAVKEIHSIFMNDVSDLEFQSFKRNFLRECEQSSRLLVWRRRPFYAPPENKRVWYALYSALVKFYRNPVQPIKTVYD